MTQSDAHTATHINADKHTHQHNPLTQLHQPAHSNLHTRMDKTQHTLISANAGATRLRVLQRQKKERPPRFPQAHALYKSSRTVGDSIPPRYSGCYTTHTDTTTAPTLMPSSHAHVHATPYTRPNTADAHLLSAAHACGDTRQEQRWGQPPPLSTRAAVNTSETAQFQHDAGNHGPYRGSS